MPETERLLLRRFAPADAGAFAALNADPEVMCFIGEGRPLTRAESDELLTRIAAHWRSHGFGLRRVAELGARAVPGLRRAGRAVVPARGDAGGRGGLAPRARQLGAGWRPRRRAPRWTRRSGRSGSRR